MSIATKIRPRGSATRKSILDAAEVQFSDAGFDAARLEDIASVIGLRRPSLLYHFPTKIDLYDAVEERIFREMHELAEARIATATEPRARLLAHLDGWLDFLVQRPTAARIILRLVSDRHLRPHNPIQFSQLVLADMEVTLTAGIQAGVFKPVTTALFVSAVAGGVLLYVCGSPQLGSVGGFDPANLVRLAEYRSLLHKLALTAVSV